MGKGYPFKNRPIFAQKSKNRSFLRYFPNPFFLRNFDILWCLHLFSLCYFHYDYNVASLMTIFLHSGNDAWWSFQRMWFIMIHFCLLFSLCHLHYVLCYLHGGNDVWWSFQRTWFMMIHSCLLFSLCYLHYVCVTFMVEMMHDDLSKGCDSWWSIFVYCFHYVIYIITMFLHSGDDAWWFFQRMWFMIVDTTFCNH